MSEGPESLQGALPGTQGSNPAGQQSVVASRDKDFWVVSKGH